MKAMVYARGTITETIVVEKEVSVVIPDLDLVYPGFEEKIETALRSEANKRTIMSENHGWALIGSEGQDVRIDLLY